MTILTAQSVRISASRIRAHVKYLASDRLQGRGVGTEGGRLATEYIASQLQAVRRASSNCSSIASSTSPK